MGKSSISMGHGFHGELLNNQRVSIKNPQSLRQSFCIPENPYHEINQIITPNSEFFVGCWSKYPKSPKKKTIKSHVFLLKSMKSHSICL